jgi:hypothetical protein
VKSQRFPFRIHLADADAVVTMDCGEGVYRARSMPVSFLRDIARFCQRSDRILAPLRRDDRLASDIPVFPDLRPLASFPFGPCTANIVASRTQGNQVELSIAFYDTDDRRAPALLLTEEQIEDFIATVDALVGLHST